MLIRVACPDCNHVGIVPAATLPRSPTCSLCGSSRLVEKGRRVISKLAFQERLLGSGDAELIDASQVSHL